MNTLPYNTEEEKLIMPEYGRNVQKMIDYCVSIEDREERTKCANAIIQTMGNMFPHLRDVNDFKHILWDHLAIMSDFKLDIDYPYEIIKKENMNTCPPHIPYNVGQMHYRHYGKILEQMIQKAADYPESPEKKQLILMVANQMKKSYLNWNKDSVADEKILKDLSDLSNGKINLTTEDIQLADARDLISKPANNSNSNNKKNYSRKGR